MLSWEVARVDNNGKEIQIPRKGDVQVAHNLAPLNAKVQTVFRSISESGDYAAKLSLQTDVAVRNKLN